MQDLSRMASSLKINGRVLHPETQRRIYSRHGSTWRNMPEAARLRYELEADRRRCDIVDALAEERSAVLAELQVRTEQGLAQIRDCLPQRLSSCRWSDSTKDAFNAMYESSPYTRSHIAARRATVVQTIMPPPQAVVTNNSYSRCKARVWSSSVALASPCSMLAQKTCSER